MYFVKFGSVLVVSPIRLFQSFLVKMIIIVEQLSTIYFKLAEITNRNELKKLQIWSENRQKVTKLSKQLQATNGLEISLFLAK